MSEVLLHTTFRGTSLIRKRLTPLGPAKGHRHEATVHAQEGAFSCERGTPVQKYFEYMRTHPPQPSGLRLTEFRV